MKKLKDVKKSDIIIVIDPETGNVMMQWPYKGKNAGNREQLINAYYSITQVKHMALDQVLAKTDVTSTEIMHLELQAYEDLNVQIEKGLSFETDKSKNKDTDNVFISSGSDTVH